MDAIIEFSNSKITHDITNFIEEDIHSITALFILIDDNIDSTEEILLNYYDMGNSTSYLLKSMNLFRQFNFLNQNLRIKKEIQTHRLVYRTTR